jgi:hypothetical protein
MEGSTLSDLMVVFLQYNVYGIEIGALLVMKGECRVVGDLRRRGRGFFDILTAPGSRTEKNRKRRVRTEPENATVTSSYATPCQTSTETCTGRAAANGLTRKQNLIFTCIQV